MSLVTSGSSQLHSQNPYGMSFATKIEPVVTQLIQSPDDEAYKRAVFKANGNTDSIEKRLLALMHKKNELVGSDEVLSEEEHDTISREER